MNELGRTSDISFLPNESGYNADVEKITYF